VQDCVGHRVCSDGSSPVDCCYTIPTATANSPSSQPVCGNICSVWGSPGVLDQDINWPAQLMIQDCPASGTEYIGSLTARTVNIHIQVPAQDSSLAAVWVGTIMTQESLALITNVPTLFNLAHIANRIYHSLH